MNSGRWYIKKAAGVILFLMAGLVYPAVKNEQQPAMENVPVSSDWLPDIVGLPNEVQLESLTVNVSSAMAEEQDKECNAIDYNLRMVVFQNFVIYQHMFNAQGLYIEEQKLLKYAHVLGMVLAESSGDPTNVTDMTGRTISTNKAKTNLQRWENLLESTIQKGIKFNEQTNFGLTQLSADRLFVAFKMAQDYHGKDFLEGKYGDATPDKEVLNTASAILRLIWFYQNIAQGRLTQDDEPILQENVDKNAFNERYQEGLKMALLYCGTRLLFNEKDQEGWSNQNANFEKAMASIAYCKLGNTQTGYGKKEIDEQCFAQWVTLCPALNLSIAFVTPLSYFQTRGYKPACVGTFRRLLNKKPENQ
ncbi:hypothetical protein [uncultured Legionella sp.]|uniref:hypothetical protein n=1 Tax=uncultured Legionella sp. TaxID=210934 RepID=UPI002614A84E|nr:hypothetical protein [uncultured Legionella sp.]